ncbi:MAG TPA: TadE/TadG family type IV pilus assembly protein [Methylocystis sp.]|nr:TadE/TadG family type IV pilus assembly protein [Methylocystis sp.]
MSDRFRWARGFAANRRGVAIVEFALVFPVAVLVAYAAFNLSRLANAERELAHLSDDIAQMIVETQAPYTTQSNSVAYCQATAPTTCGALYDYALKYIYDSAMVEFPDILTDPNGVSNQAIKAPSSGGTLSISMTGVVFAYTPSAATCGATPSVANAGCYTGYVVWTSGAATRPCSTAYLLTASYSTPTPSQLPPALFTTVANPNSASALPPLFAVVVDVVYTFKPLLSGGSMFDIVPPVTIKRSTFLNPRYVSQISYFGAGNATANNYGAGTYGTACAMPGGWPSGLSAWPH